MEGKVTGIRQSPVEHAPMRTSKVAVRTLTLNGVAVPVQMLVRPRRRQAAIQITPAGEVRLLLPPGYPVARAEELVRTKASWVLRHLQSAASHPPVLQDGATLLMGGQPATVSVREADTWHFTPEPGGGFRVTVPASTPSDAVAAYLRQSLTSHLSALAYTECVRQVARFQPLVGSPAPRRIVVGDYKSRWGVCRADGTLAFSWRLVQAPPACLTYVVVHELTHLIHRHHQPSFWQAVERVCPDHQEPRRWLNAHGRELFW